MKIILWHALHINRLLIHFLITGITTTGESLEKILHYIWTNTSLHTPGEMPEKKKDMKL